MADEEGFEPPRAFAPFGFQDRPLQPDLGIRPYISGLFNVLPLVNKIYGGP